MTRPKTEGFCPRRTVLFVFTALLVVPLTGAAGPVAAPAAEASAAAGSGRIIFRDYTTGQLYTVNPDGTALRQVTHRGYNIFPDWSPDGRRITYASSRGGGRFAVWIANVDGSRARQLTPDDPNSDNLWSHFTPDGRTVVFTNCLGGGCDGGISAIRVDGTHLHALTPNSGESYNDGVPSPNGTQLAFMRWHVGGITMRIYVRPIGGGTERPLTPPRLQAWAPDWAPGGHRIAFSSHLFNSRPNGAIYTVRADGTSLRKLTNPPWPLEDWGASYSPDGSRLVFSSDRRYPDRCCSDLYTVSASGGAIHRIPLATSAVTDASWGTSPALTDTSHPKTAAPATGPADTMSMLRLCAIVAGHGRHDTRRIGCPTNN